MSFKIQLAALKAFQQDQAPRQQQSCQQNARSEAPPGARVRPGNTDDPPYIPDAGRGGPLAAGGANGAFAVQVAFFTVGYDHAFLQAS